MIFRLIPIPKLFEVSAVGAVFFIPISTFLRVKAKPARAVFITRSFVVNFATLRIRTFIEKKLNYSKTKHEN